MRKISLGAKILRKTMLDLDLRVKDLVRLTGASRRMISYILSGQMRSPKYESIIGQVLGISVERIGKLLSDKKKKDANRRI